jgi:hypothetical protein
VPTDYQPGAETGQAWQAWFESLGSNRADTGHAVIATQALGSLDAGTRLGGYSLVTAEDIDGAAALAPRCSSAVAWKSVPFRSPPGTRGPEPMSEALNEGAVARSGTSVLPRFGLARPGPGHG